MKAKYYLILFSLILCSCSSDKIENRIWKYSDFEMNYNLSFKANGRLESTHPDDVTKDNDIWKQEGEAVTFSFNDKFSEYKFRFTGNDTIFGKAKNKKSTWDFKLIRIR